MIKSISKSTRKMITTTLPQIGKININVYRADNFKNLQSKANYNFNILTIKYFFARKVTPLFSKQTIEDQKPVKKMEIQSQSHSKPTISQRETQFYTFVDLEKDLQVYQQYLNLHNTHTKKAHEKLIKNELKIIQCIIQSKRQDLLLKFLSTNYRNRLSNLITVPTIAKYFTKKLENSFPQILKSASDCQKMLQTITLFTDYNQNQLFQTFLKLINQNLPLSPQQANKDCPLLAVLTKLPSRECQFLFIYNYLIKEKELPLYLMESQWFGIHTENLKFHNLGEVFYEVRKFVRRYFALYNKGIQVKQDNHKLKSSQRQYNKTSQRSILQKDIQCFLKVLNYPLIRRQIEIDGHIVDFVVDGIQKKQKASESNVPSTILQVMGSYHYTCTGQLKARDIRKFIILGSKYRQKKYTIKLVHYDDYNQTKGNRNKMAFIKNLLEDKDPNINFQPKNKGFDSKWQLKEVYQQFK